MSDTLVLNLALEEGPSTRREHTKKGGRWTDRLKSKRIEKRKARTQTADERPPKRPRQHTDRPPVTLRSVPQAHPKPRQPAQVISSLFSSNPKVEQKSTVSVPHTPNKPSNAPLTDSSTFTGLGLNSLIATHLTTKMNILKPTSIHASSRDAFIQAQTGSGKTLSYLLPILHDLLPLSTNSYIDRSIGTLAIIISPTRELAKQISDVLEVLLKLRLRPLDAAPDDEENNETRLTRWLVSGLLTGGATRAHEKAPDRLMELGFADTIKGILACLEGSRKLALQAVKGGQSMEVRGWDWGVRRRTILCSATMREDVQVLAGAALQNPIIIKTTELDLPGPATDANEGAAADPKFTPPSQLLQKYIVVPLKLRLVALIALLRSLLSQSGGRGSFKIIVFLSCTDSNDGNRESGSDQAAPGEDGSIEVHSPLLPDTSIFRLHGSLPQATRHSSLRAFSSSPKAPEVGRAASVLLCTSVAARGLDLPRVRVVVQYDLPTEGGATEYVHRVGRTARAGHGGQAWTIIAPSEEPWVEWVQARMASGTTEGGAANSLKAVAVEEILQAGFGGKGREYEDRATEVQLSFERWCLQGKENAEMARKAFASHLRAYATHPSDEKHIFHIRHLHLGHLAKSFALREAPGTISGHGGKSHGTAGGKKKARRLKQRGGENDGHDEGEGDLDVERRMNMAVRNQGRLVKKGGAMVSSGLWEFQVASGDALERLVNKT
ncbi:P-loop containing nucleoside triphosphate hydrolase protein [Russula vinacea]|nr:P-loop containing nucleoside triphosphate hydrolase protein [Russula vinacea]